MLPSLPGEGSKGTKKHPPTVIVELSLPEHSDNADPESMVFDWSKLWEKKTGRKWSEQVPKSEDQLATEALIARLEEKYGKDEIYGKGRHKDKSALYEGLDIAGMGYDTEDTFIDDSEAHDEVLPSHLRPEKRGFYFNVGPLNLVPVSDDDDEEEEGTRKSSVSTLSTPTTAPSTSRTGRARIDSSSSEDTPLSELSSRRSSPDPVSGGKDSARPSTPMKRLSAGLPPSGNKKKQRYSLPPSSSAAATKASQLKKKAAKGSPLPLPKKKAKLATSESTHKALPAQPKKPKEPVAPGQAQAASAPLAPPPPKAKETKAAEVSTTTADIRIANTIASVLSESSGLKEAKTTTTPTTATTTATTTMTTTAKAAAAKEETSPFKFPLEVKTIMGRFKAALEGAKEGGRSRMGDDSDAILLELFNITGEDRKLRKAAFDAIANVAGCQPVNLRHRVTRFSEKQKETSQASLNPPKPPQPIPASDQPQPSKAVDVTEKAKLASSSGRKSGTASLAHPSPPPPPPAASTSPVILGRSTPPVKASSAQAKASLASKSSLSQFSPQSASSSGKAEERRKVAGASPAAKTTPVGPFHSTPIFQSIPQVPISWHSPSPSPSPATPKVVDLTGNAKPQQKSPLQSSSSSSVPKQTSPSPNPRRPAGSLPTAATSSSSPSPTKQEPRQKFPPSPNHRPGLPSNFLPTNLGSKHPTQTATFAQSQSLLHPPPKNPPAQPILPNYTRTLTITPSSQPGQVRNPILGAGQSLSGQSSGRRVGREDIAAAAASSTEPNQFAKWLDSVDGSLNMSHPIPEARWSGANPSRPIQPSQARGTTTTAHNKSSSGSYPQYQPGSSSSHQHFSYPVAAKEFSQRAQFPPINSQPGSDPRNFLARAHPPPSFPQYPPRP